MVCIGVDPAGYGTEGGSITSEADGSELSAELTSPLDEVEGVFEGFHYLRGRNNVWYHV